MEPISSGSRAPALRLAVCISAGIILHRVAALPPSLVWSVAFGLVVLLGITLLRGPTAGPVPAWVASGAGVLCILLGLGRAAESSSYRVPIADSLLFVPVTLVGTITDDPAGGDARLRFPLADAFVIYAGRHTALPGQVLVRCWRSDDTDDGLRYGMRVGLRGRLERPSPARNPGEFDARLYYEANGVFLLFRGERAGTVAIVDAGGGDWWMRLLVLPVRRALLRQIEKSVGGNEGEFLKGILIGDRSGLSRPLRDAFVRSGTAHILAVSGSNVAVVAGMIFMLLEVVRASRRWRVILTCLGIVFYMMLTGGQPPVVRAGVMAVILLLAGLAQERPSVLNSLGVAASAILLFEPRQIADVGFQLSFAAVLSIVLLYPGFRGWIDRVRWRGPAGHVTRSALRLSALSLAATLGTLPLTALWFGSVSVIGLLANILVVPAAGASVVLGGVAATCALFSEGMANAYAAVNAVVLRLAILTAEYTGGLSFAVLETPGFRPVDAIPVCALLLLLLRVQQRRNPFLPCVLFLAGVLAAMFVPASLPPVSGSLRVTFLDVGQGDATLCQFPAGATALIDGGAWSPEYDAGERVVVPYLRRRGVAELDLLVATHAHHDHIGGLPSVLRSLPVRHVLDPGQPVSSPVYASFNSLVRARAKIRETGRAGSIVPIDPAVRVYVLWPRPEFVSGDSAVLPDLNNTSLVLKICHGTVSFLLAGDAGVEAEEAMVRMYGGFLRSTVLKVGHHGSSGSSSGEFLDAVRPQYAIVSVGRGNSFGHPSPEILERFRRRGIEVLRTDGEGAVILETDGGTLRRIMWR